MSKGFAPVIRRQVAVQHEDLTVNMTVYLFLKSWCLHIYRRIYVASDGKTKQERHANQKRFGELV